eukprot:scaffold18257_cov78-Cylindrotheca_fusiformis.AAC.1
MEAKALMEEVREASETYAQQQKEARLRAQNELREVQEELDEVRMLAERPRNEGGESSSLVLSLQEQLSAKTNENQQLQTMIQEYQKQLKEQKQEFLEQMNQSKEEEE